MPKQKAIKDNDTMTILAAKYFGMIDEPMAEAVEQARHRWELHEMCAELGTSINGPKHRGDWWESVKGRLS